MRQLSAQITLWSKRLELTLDVLQQAGAKVEQVFRQGAPDPIRKGAPNHSVLRGAEHDVDRKIPSVLTGIFREQVALHGSFRLPAEVGSELPDGLRDVLWGGVDLSVREMLTAEMARQALVSEYFDDVKDPLHAPWHGKFAFQSIANGDYLALSDATGAVYYLSPDARELHGVELAPSLVDFLDRWSQIGFVGPESALLLPFLGEKTGLDASGVAARAWRGALKLGGLEGDSAI